MLIWFTVLLEVDPPVSLCVNTFPNQSDLTRRDASDICDIKKI